MQRTEGHMGYSAAALAGLLLLLPPLPAAASGGGLIRGTVVLGPTCSGPVLEGPGCSEPWVDAHVVVLDGAGQRLLASQRSNAHGGFSFNLPAGHYRVTVQTQKVTRCPVIDVHLTGVQPRPIGIDCDTGRR